MLLHDPYALHRKWWDADWSPGPNDKDWTGWDYILADVCQLIEDFTDKESGAWLPYDDSGDVFWDVKSRVSGALEAIEKEQDSRKDDLNPGERLYAVPIFDPNKPKPTIESWAKDVAEEKASRVPSEHREARPPTPEELRSLGF